MSKVEITKRIEIVVSAVVISFFVWFLVNQGWKIRWDVPWIYEGRDDFLHEMIIKKAVNWQNIWTDEHLGYPFTQEMYGFPLVAFCSVWIGRIVGLFTKNYAIATNIYLLFCILFASGSFAYVANTLKVSNKAAILGGILFSFSQYSFSHNAHFAAICYGSVPLICLLCYYVYSGCYTSNRRFVGKCLIICYIAACADPFYAFFGCFLILVCSLGALLCKEIKNFFLGIKFIFAIVISMCINLYPCIVYALNNSSNNAERTANEAFYWGLKLIALVTPLYDKHPFSWIREKYIQNGLPTGENISNYLGIFAIIGFIAIMLFTIALYYRGELKEQKNTCTWKFISLLNMFALLLGVSGGIGLAFAVLVTPQVRTYNRIFVFIYFCSMIAAMLLLDFVYTQHFAKMKVGILAVIGLGIIMIHCIDIQILRAVPDYEKSETQYEADSDFINDIETSVGSGGKILVLPWLTFPENRTETDLTNYLSPLSGWFHSENLYWSIGILQGSGEDIILKDRYDTDNIDDILKHAIEDNFDGIYIALDAYKNPSEIINGLQNKTGVYPMYNKEQDACFFNIQHIAEESETNQVYIIPQKGF